jgi:hypothetical protein
MIKSSGSSPPGGLEHSELNLNCYLPKNINRDQATTWFADWLDEFRQLAISRDDALRLIRHPKYLKGVFA